MIYAYAPQHLGVSPPLYSISHSYTPDIINKHRKITLKSYRHSYGIVRVHMTGNIQGVAVEMGHSNLPTTQEYLNIPPNMVADAFPSVEQHLTLNEPKIDIRGTDLRGTVYSNVPKLPNSIGN